MLLVVLVLVVVLVVLVVTTVQGTKKASRLGRVVKNLVTNDEKERMKEEMAWQVISLST